MDDSLIQSPGQQLAYMPHADPEAFAETLVALANADGGSVVIGISATGKPGTLVGEEDAVDALTAALRLCRPPMVTEWSMQPGPTGPVVVLRVPRSGELHTLWDGRVLVRRGAENRPLAGADIDSVLGGRTTGEFELQEVAGATRQDLDDKVIDTYLERRLERSPSSTPMPKDRLLQQIGALSESMTPTVSGLLLFGREPQLFLPHSRAIFVRFADAHAPAPDAIRTGGFGYGRREEFLGPLPVILESAWRVILQEMDKRSVVRGLHRREETEYPVFAVREALVNAVAHRDYRLTGRSIEIRMYTDRLEITSPGGLPAHITLDNIVEEHYSRNPRIVNGLYQWGYIEELGLGIDRMIDEMVAAGHNPPKFEAKSHRFTVIMTNNRDAGRAVEAWENNMNERQIKAMEYLQRTGSITNRDYRELCPHVGQETIRLDLADLVSKGVLLKIGDKRGTRYILK